MKILWISDYSLVHTKGGAQRSDDIIIEEGRGMGFDITWLNVDSYPALMDQNYDHVISTNLEQISQTSPHIVNWLQHHPQHSRLEHDMCAYLSPDDRKLLFSNCKNTFFLTQFHYNLFKNAYGDFFKNVNIVSDPIDTRVFYDKRIERQDKILYVGMMHMLKGTELFFNYVFDNPDRDFIVAGWGGGMYEFLAKSAPNVEFLGTVDYKDMPNIYNAYEQMMYLPVASEPFCRSIGEAILCGMKVNTKIGTIGCLEELEKVGMDKFKENCNNAPKDFWKIISK
jgi:hypothetical protein